MLAQLETDDILLSIDDATVETRQIEATLSDLQDKYASYSQEPMGRRRNTPVGKGRPIGN